ncbi:hypothetical protein SD78_3165 [Bacillus badius]|nr:hypothetical protein SD78_3165 [Bacillus badius]
MSRFKENLLGSREKTDIYPGPVWLDYLKILNMLSLWKRRKGDKQKGKSLLSCLSYIVASSSE